MEAAVDGYVLRETPYGPNRSGYQPRAPGAGAGARGRRRARDHLVVIGALETLHKRAAARDLVWTFFSNLLDQATLLPWRATLCEERTELIEDELVERLRDDIKQAATVDMWLPRGPLRALPSLLPELVRCRNSSMASDLVFYPRHTCSYACRIC